jgi:hypothetical protein
MDVKATYTIHFVSCAERPNLLATQNFPPGWNFSFGALVFLFQNQYTHGTKIAAPKVLHGLMAAGTDIWIRELSRKTLGQSYVPATVSMSYQLAC